jgi:hypothetical protein
MDRGALEKANENTSASGKRPAASSDVLFNFHKARLYIVKQNLQVFFKLFF